MSQAEWAVIEPALPAPAWKQGRGGRPARHCRRDIVDSIRYLVKEGIQDRDAAKPLLWNLTKAFPAIRPDHPDPGRPARVTD